MINAINYYYSRFGASGVVAAIGSKLNLTQKLIEVKRSEIKHPFYLRPKTSDVPTYEQIFINRDYNFSITKEPEIIIDAGANIGLASIYFANQYPNSQVIAIEPELSNFKLLEVNVSPYKNVIPLQAALWHRNEEINLIDPGLGEWAFMTESKNEELQSEENIVRNTVQAITVDRIIDQFNLNRIDILKIDIEGAEKEVFTNPSSWIHKVDTMIVELHERIKIGCNRSFYNNTNGFPCEWKRGENIYLSRGNCAEA